MERAIEARALQLAALALAIFSASVARTALGPMQEAVRIDLALSDNQIASLQGPAMALPMAIAAIPLSTIINTCRRTRVLLILVLLSIVCSLLTVLTFELSWLFVIRCFLGLTSLSTGPLAFSILADLYSQPTRGRAVTAIALGQAFGQSAAFAGGGLLLATFGSTSGAWRWATVWLTGPLLVTFPLMFVLREPPRRETSATRSSTRNGFELLWRHRVMVATLLSGVVVEQVAGGAAFIWAAPTFARSFQLDPKQIGFEIGLALLASGTLAAIVGGSVADLCQRLGGPRRTVGVLSLLALLSSPAGLFAIMPVAGAADAMLIAFLVLGGVIGVMAVALSIVAMPNEIRALYLSIQTAMGLLMGLGLAPLTVSLISTAIGGPTKIGQALAIVCALLSLLGALVFYLGRRGFPRAPRLTEPL